MWRLKFAAICVLFLPALGVAAEPYCDDRPAETPYVYTLAKKFADKEEYTYQELSFFWKRTNRDKINFVRLPTANVTSTIGLCGTYHYNPDMLAHTPEEFEKYKKGAGRGTGIQNNQEVGSYMTDTAACRFTEVLQEWTKECEVFNPDKNICAIGWGDSSHRDSKKFEPHSVKYHGFGDCIDIRPIKKGSLEEFKAEHTKDPELPLFLKRTDEYKKWITSSTDTYYDREKTRKLLQIMKEKGGGPIFFQDKVMEKEKGWGKNPAFTTMKGHANHIHVCFPDNEKNRQACENFRYKRAECGPLLY